MDLIDFESASIPLLQRKAYELFESYIALDDWRNPNDARQHAYKKFSMKLGALYGDSSIGKMETREELMRAITALRKLYFKRKKKKEYFNSKTDKALPYSQMKEALAALKRGDKVA